MEKRAPVMARDAPTPPPGNKVVPTEWNFDQATTDENLVFAPPQEESHISPIKRATLTKLIEYFTSVQPGDANLRQSFLLTYRMYMKPLDLLSALRARYLWAYSLEAQMSAPIRLSDATSVIDKLRCAVLSLRCRVLRMSLEWSDIVPSDFQGEDGAELREAMRAFLSSTASFVEGALIVRRFCAMLDQGAAHTEEPLIVNPPYAPAYTLLNLDAQEVARQLTLLEWELIRRVRPREMVNNAWLRPDKDTNAPNLICLVSYFNRVSHWVGCSVLYEANPSDRAAVITFMANVANTCRTLNNTATLMQVICALQATAVTRLQATWKHVPKETLTILDELNNLVTPAMGYVAYRRFCRAMTPPCVLYLGMPLKDLVFIEEGHPAYAGPEAIYPGKFMTTASVIRDIIAKHAVPYPFPCIPPLRAYLLRSMLLLPAEQQLWEDSTLIEPRNAAVVRIL